MDYGDEEDVSSELFSASCAYQRDAVMRKSQFVVSTVVLILLPRPRASYCFRSISLFICFFVTRLRENGWTDLHEIFREVWSDHGTT